MVLFPLAWDLTGWLPAGGVGLSGLRNLHSRMECFGLFLCTGSCKWTVAKYKSFSFLDWDMTEIRLYLPFRIWMFFRIRSSSLVINKLFPQSLEHSILCLGCLDVGNITKYHKIKTTTCTSLDFSSKPHTAYKPVQCMGRFSWLLIDVICSRPLLSWKINTFIQTYNFLICLKDCRQSGCDFEVDTRGMQSGAFCI